MKRILPLAIALAGASFAQVDVAPFWRAVDSVSKSFGNSVNDLYTDLSLLDTIKLAGETFPITWKSSGDFPILQIGSNSIGGSGWSKITIDKRERWL